MNKQEATKLIASDLARNHYVTIVEDKMIKKHVFKNNRGCVRLYVPNLEQIIENCRNAESGDSTHRNFSGIYQELFESIKTGLIESEAANYAFINTETFFHSNQHRFILGAKASITPFAIVTDVEIDQIREAYHGYPPEKVKEALKILEIDMKEISLDYKFLAENDPETFLKQYKGVDEKSKIDVIQTIAECRIHPQIKTFLTSDENYEVMIKAARDGVSR